MLIRNAVPVPTFSHHETFHLRYGWLKRSYNQIQDNPQVFQSDKAPIKLGVGKNMVRAIKFWSMATKIIEPYGNIKNSSMRSTEIGYNIFDEKKLDPYLEKPDTLWLLHWLLFAPPCRIPVWWLVMNEFHARNIKIDEMTKSIITRITNISEWNTPSPKSIKKDMDVFVHTYTTNHGKFSIEDYLDCPFRQLHMVKQSSRDRMMFVFGKKPGLSPLITAFACLDFIDREGTKSNSISLSRLTNEAGSVGNIFKINENDLEDLLEEACNESKSIKLRNINGTQNLIFDSAKKASLEMLHLIYGKKITSPPGYAKIQNLDTVPLPKRKKIARSNGHAERENLDTVPLPKRKKIARSNGHAERENLDTVPLPKRKKIARSNGHAERENLDTVPLPKRKKIARSNGHAERENLDTVPLPKRKKIARSNGHAKMEMTH